MGCRGIIGRVGAAESETVTVTGGSRTIQRSENPCLVVIIDRCYLDDPTVMFIGRIVLFREDNCLLGRINLENLLSFGYIRTFDKFNNNCKEFAKAEKNRAAIKDCLEYRVVTSQVAHACELMASGSGLAIQYSKIRRS